MERNQKINISVMDYRGGVFELRNTNNFNIRTKNEIVSIEINKIDVMNKFLRLDMLNKKSNNGKMLINGIEISSIVKSLNLPKLEMQVLLKNQIKLINSIALSNKIKDNN